jgi:SAM-dependent methyltransferase
LIPDNALSSTCYSAHAGAATGHRVVFWRNVRAILSFHVSPLQRCAHSRIVGVDAAANMLRQFEKLANERGVKVEAVHAYAEAVPLPGDSFDVVVSRLAPHYFSDVAKAVQEMARVASGSGGVAVIDLEGDEEQALDDLNHEIEVLHDPTHPPRSATGWKPVLSRRVSFSPPASAWRRSGLAGSSSREERNGLCLWGLFPARTNAH